MASPPFCFAGWVALTGWQLLIVEQGADEAADYAALDGGAAVAAAGGHIALELVGELGDGEGLEPDASGALEHGEEDSVAAEDHVLDAADGGDLEVDAGLECADVAGVYLEDFAGGEVLDDDFAGEFEPEGADAGDLLEEESVAAEDACAEGLLEADGELDLVRGAEEAVAVDEDFVAGADFDGDDVAGDAGGEGDFAGGTEGAVLGHEEGAAGGDALECAEESAAAAELGVGGHLDGLGHPAEFAGFGDDAVVVVEEEFEDGHGGAHNAALHDGLLLGKGVREQWKWVRGKYIAGGGRKQTPCGSDNMKGKCGSSYARIRHRSPSARDRWHPTLMGDGARGVCGCHPFHGGAVEWMGHSSIGGGWMGGSWVFRRMGE